jgi:hypothetical protein
MVSLEAWPPSHCRSFRSSRAHPLIKAKQWRVHKCTLVFDTNVQWLGRLSLQYSQLQAKKESRHATYERDASSRCSTRPPTG